MNERRPAMLASGAVLAVAVVCCVLAIAACGSSKTSGTAGSAGSSASTGGAASTSSTLAFSTCMRTSGVPNFPDIPSGGIRIAANGQTLAIDGVTVNAPAFEAARQKCEHYLPHVTASPAQATRKLNSALKFAECMRGHGVPTFPDPKKNTTGAGGGQAVDLRGSGLNLQSPALQAAFKACGGPKGP